MNSLKIEKSLRHKDTLAKLMATENIAIVHNDNISTAAFDIENRVLYLPDFVNLGEDVYDLLISHEVSHALNTPVEGYHDAVDKEKSPKFKGFLNIVEDARIEKMIQRKFPGLKKSYLSGYKKLFDKDIFGISKFTQEELDDMLLIDRLNIRSKLGKLYSTVKIKPEEKHFETKMENLETWKDVVTLSEELFEYCKEELEKKNQEDDTIISQKSENDDKEQSDSNEQNEKESNSEKDGEEDGNDKNSEEEGDEDESNSDGDENSEDEDNEDASGSLNDNQEPESYTDKMFRENENELVNQQNYEDYVEFLTLEMPVVNLSSFVTDSKTVLGEISKIMKKNNSIDLRELISDDNGDSDDDSEFETYDRFF